MNAEKMEIEVVTEEKRFFELEHEWNDAVRRAPYKTAFNIFGWYKTWWIAVGRNYVNCKLSIYIGRSSEIPIIILPFVKTLIDGKKTLAFISCPYADYQDIILGPEEEVFRYRNELMDLLTSLKISCELIFLDEIREESNLFLLKRSIGKNKAECEWLYKGWETSSSCLAMDLRDSSSLAAIFDPKKEICRKEKQLMRKGAVKCFHFKSRQEIGERYDGFIEMHKRQWENNPKAKYTFYDLEILNFYKELVKHMTALSNLILTELNFNDAPIAYYLGFCLGDVYYAYRTSYHLDFFRYSPGHILLKNLFLYLKVNRYTVFDFMRGDYGYKFQYGSVLRNNRKIRYLSN